MKVNVGSKNETKVRAVKEALSEFPEFSKAEIVSVEVDPGVHKQPKNMEQTVQGAMNRAEKAFKDCDLSVGLESGLIEVPKTKSGYMDITNAQFSTAKISTWADLPPLNIQNL
ncbi:MAG: putative non-canonical purine NTP phosphatase [Candidatus Giovannonibacteria bacterium GW2011_GWC2_44_8]|uniref:inosine/xanthosine triphosphatase n=1 Tax=Candidatus Giovannonibacteria bacterium GW2011_GWC2_44_8 TaxID=1618657 RepID=A0A0G1K654_9BACT|nr:MAG: putative non-canonical purine NTP phosphatase [Candidatus Giovannonibacteria bacterium GW2011_GWC2_44_8]